MKIRFSNWIWGTFMLLAAVFVISTQFNGFVEIGIGSIIAAVLALAFLVQCIAQKSFALIPIPLAMLYIIFQMTLAWPYMRAWTLLLAAVFASIGLAALTPNKFKSNSNTRDFSGKTDSYGESGNNLVVNANFTAMSRTIISDALEIVHLNCSFSGLEVFFDRAKLNPNGAQVICDCKFGAISIIVPKEWRIVDKLNCTLGGVDNKSRFSSPAEDAPQLTISGEVSLGGIEIKCV